MLVHGVSASSRTWWRVGPWFARQGWYTVALDLRGHGASPRATRNLTLEDLAEDLRETVLELPGEKVDVLLGHSLGALAALELCATHGGLVERLVLEEPPSGDVDFGEISRMLQEDAARAREDPDAMKRQRLEESFLSEGDAERSVAALRECDAEPIAALIQNLHFDLSDLVKSSEVPTLLILGSETQGSALPKPERTVVARALYEGTVKEFETGHGVHRDDFEGYVGLLGRWLGGPGGRS